MAARCHTLPHLCGGAAHTAHSAQRCVNSTARLANGQPVCTKVECQRCFLTHGWDWAAADADPRWHCSHCRGVCPRREAATPAASGVFSAELHAAQQRAAYFACLQSIGGSAAAEGTPSDFVDRLASYLSAGDEPAGATAVPGGVQPPPAPSPWANLTHLGLPPPPEYTPSAMSSARDSGLRMGTPHHDRGEGERLACWGSPEVRGDAWSHEGGAAVAVTLRCGGGGAARAHPVFVLVGGRTTYDNGGGSGGNGGGSGGGGGGGTLIHVFDVTRREWLPVRQTGTPPHRLRAHSLICIESGGAGGGAGGGAVGAAGSGAGGSHGLAGDRLIVYGGGDGKRISADLYTLEITPESLDVVTGGVGLASTSLLATVAAVARTSMAAASGAPTGVIASWSHPQVRRSSWRSSSRPTIHLAHASAHHGAPPPLPTGQGFSAPAAGGPLCGGARQPDDRVWRFRAIGRRRHSFRDAHG